MDLSDLKWVSKRNLQTFWDGIKGSLFGDLAFHEDGAESAHAYSAGDLLGHESHLYRATSSIAAGDTLESGVNMERTLVDAEIERVLGDIASFDSGATAASAHKVGSFIIRNHNLYRVTSPIAVGDTFTVNTNIVQTTIADEMENRTLVFDSVPVSAATGVIIDFDDPRITDKHTLVRCVFTNPSYITEITSGLITTAGNMTLSGVCTNPTTAYIKLSW